MITEVCVLVQLLNTCLVRITDTPFDADDMGPSVGVGRFSYTVGRAFARCKVRTCYIPAKGNVKLFFAWCCLSTLIRSTAFERRTM